MKWIKWYTSWLQSTIRDQLLPAERATFHDMVCLASLNDESLGQFKLASWESLARKFNTPLEVILSTRDKCLSDRISISQNSAGEIIVSVLNWERYQAVKPASKVSTESPESLAIIQSRLDKIRVDKKREEEKREDASPPPPPLPLEAAASGKLPVPETFEELNLSDFKARFPTLDITWELAKCAEWWRANGKTLKSPRLAFGNWCAKALRFTAENIPPPHPKHNSPEEQAIAKLAHQRETKRLQEWARERKATGQDVPPHILARIAPPGEKPDAP